MSKRDKRIDKVLDGYASDRFGVPYTWWWNGSDILADAIASLCRHLRKDGHTDFTQVEVDELRRLERWMRVVPEDSCCVVTTQEKWLHAEAMWLLGKWFTRLWD